MWDEYIPIRQEIINRLKHGDIIHHHLIPISKTHSVVFGHDLYYPTCSTTVIEMVLELEKVFKNKDNKI